MSAIRQYAAGWRRRRLIRPVGAPAYSAGRHTPYPISLTAYAAGAVFPCGPA
ncbi:hypothetical protein KCP78_21365 [Salmonella enterica subsp. enterica]|nr:hypothetical protein KCP78_21365 [Salmonella enterica subsp. enterica]